MAAVLDRLAEAPKTGLPYRTIRNRLIRRILIARTSYKQWAAQHVEGRALPTPGRAVDDES